MRMFKLLNNIFSIRNKKNTRIKTDYFKPKLHYSDALKKSNLKIKYNEQFETKDFTLKI